MMFIKQTPMHPRDKFEKVEKLKKNWWNQVYKTSSCSSKR